MTGDTYRFLLRMPQELRRRLNESAEDAGRSLNGEIVHRLEQSLDEPAAATHRPTEHLKTKGDHVRRLRSRRPLVALALVVLVAAGLAVVGATQHTSKLPHATRYLKNDPDAHTVISAHHSNLGSPDSYEAQQVAELAYPSNTLKASLFQHARDYFTGHIRGRSHEHSNGWQLVGPSTATQPAVLNFFDNQASDFQVSGRVTAMAVDPHCSASQCRLWVAAAGGGIWRNDNALDSHSHWTYLSGDFGTNAIGALTYDSSTGTLYAGTGEPNASGDSESGVGIYASRDGGNSWYFLPGSLSTMFARSISSITVDPHNPRTLYVGTARGVRGVSSVTGGAVSLAPDAAAWGLWKTTDGGRSFTQVWDGAGTIRGVNHVEMDSHGTIYASAFGEGIWRSSDGGSTWEQVFASQDPGDSSSRTEFALNTTPDGHTRIYVGDGGVELNATIGPFGVPASNSGVYRGDAVDTKTSAQLTDGVTNPGFVALTSTTDPSDPTYDYCEGQCWYDNYVVSPAGHPDTVYVGGSFDYNFYYAFNSGRGVLLSQDAGQTWTDQTRDNASPTTGIHPDQHSLVVDPANPLLFFEGSDGGVVRSSGQLTDASGNCYTGYGTYTSNCQEMLSAVPTKITTLNDGLSTLQFQNAVPDGNGNLIGGTQDNGTWLGSQSSSSWNQTIYGDGGVAQFDSQNPSIMLNEFYDQASDVNFENGDPSAWVITSAPFYLSNEGSEFYKPQLADPVVGGTLFAGLQHVWRTKDDGGDKSTLEANCPEFTVYANTPGCGDWVALGDPAGTGGPGTPGDLTSASYGDRNGGFVAALARTPSDSSTLWAATATGRVFVSTNADAPTTGAVTFTRIDNASSPNRFVSGITIDPGNADRAWITYTGYNANTPSTPGHVFQVDYNPTAGTATWTDIDNGTGPIGDLPVTGIARDDATGTLYVSTDFTVLADSASPNGTYDGNWRPAAGSLPLVEVAGVTIDAKSRTLYAATHGRGIWSLQLPAASGGHGGGGHGHGH